MSDAFSIELLELKNNMLFAGGTTLSDLSPAQTFICVYEVTGKQRKQIATVSLTLETIIMDGDPVETATKGDSVLIGLSGEWDALLNAVKKLRWQRKSGRTLRTSKADVVLAES